MILHVYAYRDKKIGAFMVPTFTTDTKEVALEKLSRSIKVDDEKKAEKLKDLDLYYIGVYDDKTGILAPIQPEFLLSLDEVIVYDK